MYSTNNTIQDNNKYETLHLLRLGDIGWVFPDTELKVKSEDHEKALNLALNKVSGEWDEIKLAPLLEDLSLKGFDIELTGFDDVELELYTDDYDLDDFNDFLDFEEENEEYETPEDMRNVAGQEINPSYIVMVAFSSPEVSNKFLEYLGTDKKMDKTTVKLNGDELDFN